jgi:predicted alpha/beta superfamily hydrolase
MRKLLLITFAIFLSKLMIGQSNEVTIPGSQTKTFTSSTVSGQEYILQISLPASYDKTNQKYPVVFLMDSQWDFPLLTAL